MNRSILITFLVASHPLHCLTLLLLHTISVVRITILVIYSSYVIIRMNEEMNQFYYRILLNHELSWIQSMIS